MAGLARQSRILDFSPEQLRLLTHGRVVDTTLLRETFGYTPAYSTEQALACLAAAQGPGLLPPARIAEWTDRLARTLPVTPVTIERTQG
jgi:UDP-glucose 4-epimerase